MGANTKDTGVKTTRTAFEIVETLVREDGLRLTELATELGLAKSTAHRHLSTLQQLGYVVEENGVYRIGFKFLKLGEYTRTHLPEYQMTVQKVAEIAEQTDERAQFIVEEQSEAVYVFRETGEHAVQTDSAIGKRIPLHATAAGKAILAHLPERRVESIVDEHGLHAMTENTIVDESALYEELATIRERGYSFNNQENINGLRAVGVPVRYPDGSVFGALSVSGPTHRFRGDLLEDDLPALLLGTANELELNIKYSGA